jgi:hypothetical protein
MAVYDFDHQMRQGDQAAEFLDAFFRAKGYAIRPATRDEQRAGIDRAFTSPKDGKTWLVEYKADTAAARTGNAFIETVSVDAAGKMGWALTAKSDILVYYIPPTGVIYVLQFKTLQFELPRWIRDYPPRSAKNDKYSTHGIIIPLTELDRSALRIYQVGQNGTDQTGPAS